MKLKDYLTEDLGAGDITTDALVADERATAVITAKDDCVLAGLEEAIEIFEILELKAKPNARDGEWIPKGKDVLTIQGGAKNILKAERTALNFIMRMSGIATETKMLVDKCRKVNKHIKIAATRKTTPGFRVFEKKAVVIGGGFPHRHTLSDAILIKDNHLKVTGSIKDAMMKARRQKKAGKSTKAQLIKQPLKIEIEVTSVKDSVEATKEHPDIIMLDNMKPGEVREAYRRIKAINNKIEVEVSGNITSRNIIQYAKYADTISLGAITHSSRARNFSLEIIKVQR